MPIVPKPDDNAVDSYPPPRKTALELAGRLLALAELLGGPDRQTVTEAAAMLAHAERMREALHNLVADWERVHGPIPADHEARAALK